MVLPCIENRQPEPQTQGQCLHTHLTPSLRSGLATTLSPHHEPAQLTHHWGDPDSGGGLRAPSLSTASLGVLQQSHSDATDLGSTSRSTGHHHFSASRWSPRRAPASHRHSLQQCLKAHDKDPPVTSSPLRTGSCVPNLRSPSAVSKPSHASLWASRSQGRPPSRLHASSLDLQDPPQGSHQSHDSVMTLYV